MLLNGKKKICHITKTSQFQGHFTQRQEHTLMSACLLELDQHPILNILYFCLSINHIKEKSFAYPAIDLARVSLWEIQGLVRSSKHHTEEDLHVCWQTYVCRQNEDNISYITRTLQNKKNPPEWNFLHAWLCFFFFSFPAVILKHLPLTLNT